MSLLPLYPLSRPAASLCALFRQHPAGLETVFFQQFVPVPARDTGHACGGPGIVAAQRPYPGHIVPLRLMPPAAQRRKGPPCFRHGRQVGHATGPGFGQRGTDLPATRPFPARLRATATRRPVARCAGNSRDACSAARQARSSVWNSSRTLPGQRCAYSRFQKPCSISVTGFPAM